jgi:hypothetical protein
MSSDLKPLQNYSLLFRSLLLFLPVREKSERQQIQPTELYKYWDGAGGL